MLKVRKRQLLTSADTLKSAISDISAGNDSQDMFDFLTQCQDLAVNIGTSIENTYPDADWTKDIVSLLEEFCESIFELSRNLSDENKVNESKEHLSLLVDNIITAISDLVPKDKKEVVFFPYKASMWDSLESIYLAAKDDPECDAYVVPIPYYDRNPDLSMGQMHYEGDKYPSDIPVEDWESYDLEYRHPDVAYIHNPYDEYNYVTSVHPNFYSHEIKKYAELLIYVPYYATSGGMGENFSMLSAYNYADAIVVQSPKYEEFFDESIRHKLKFFGSPKFDKVIRKCQNPPTPPAAWQEKMAGKRVFFYNTSLHGMLANTPSFLKKVIYVFDTFRQHPEVCLIWRPHPLLESTFESMRPKYLEIYRNLVKMYRQEGFGIYDDTSDISDTIALSDVYIGDSGTSVTSLFGIAGKPLFILNDYIHREPNSDDWKSVLYGVTPFTSNANWLVTNNNMLLHSQPGEFNYKYVCKLCNYVGGAFYINAHEYPKRGVTYVCPGNAQNIVVIKDDKIYKRIELEHRTDKMGAFIDSLKIGKYIYLLPNNYESLVILNTYTDEVMYVGGIYSRYIAKVNGQTYYGGVCNYKNKLAIGHPVDNNITVVDVNEHSMTEYDLPEVCNKYGIGFLAADGDEFWITPLKGSVVYRYNPLTNAVQEYDIFPEETVCFNPVDGSTNMLYPFSKPYITEQYVYIPALYANLNARINKNTKKIERWNVRFERKHDEDSYIPVAGSCFLNGGDDNGTQLMWNNVTKNIYRINLDTGIEKFVETSYDNEAINSNWPGFGVNHKDLQYSINEDAYNTLTGIIEDNYVGHRHNCDEQIASFEDIASNPDGTCGVKTHEYAMSMFKGEV